MIIAILLALRVTCSIVYIIGVTKGFGDCYELMKKEEKEQHKTEYYGKDKNNNSETDGQQAHN